MLYHSFSHPVTKFFQANDKQLNKALTEAEILLETEKTNVTYNLADGKLLFANRQ